MTLIKIMLYPHRSWFPCSQLVRICHGVQRYTTRCRQIIRIGLICPGTLPCGISPHSLTQPNVGSCWLTLVLTTMPHMCQTDSHLLQLQKRRSLTWPSARPASLFTHVLWWAPGMLGRPPFVRDFLEEAMRQLQIFLTKRNLKALSTVW